MQLALIIALSLHVLAAVFWAGTSFTLARIGAVGAERLFAPQMGAAVVAILSGGYLWHTVHAGTFGTGERLLAAGAVSALIAAVVQGVLGARAVRRLHGEVDQAAQARSHLAVAQRVAAVLLAVAAICMGAARYA